MSVRLPSRVPHVFLVLLSFSLPSFCVAQNLQVSPSEAANRTAASALPIDVAPEYHEDFSALSLTGSAFFPLRPALGQTDDSPQFSFTRERWQLMWRPADPIDLFVCKPRGVSKPPVIVYLYSSPSTTERFKSDEWCGAATSGGFAAIGFVSAFTGHRLDMRSPAATFFSDFQQSIGATVHDVQLILDYLAARGDLDIGRVGMFGQGSGGTIAILASAADPRIKALDVLTPWADWPGFFTQQTRYIAPEKRSKFSAPDFLSSIAPLEPLTWLPKVKATSLRIQDVRKSGPMPDASQERLEAVAPQIAFINEYGDPGSFASHVSGGALFSWLRSQLQSGSGPHAPADDSQRIHVFPPSPSPLPPVGAPDKN